MSIPKEILKLNEDLSNAYLELQEYTQVFGDSELRIQLLNKVAPTFFVIIHSFYWNSFIMSISRLTDTCRSKNKNLSLDTLLNLQDCLDLEKRKILTEKILIIKSEAREIRLFRSKYIAHRDLKYALEYENMGNIDLDKIQNIYGQISFCLNLFNSHFLNTNIGHQHGFSFKPGARLLIHYLKEGIIYEEFKLRRKDTRLDDEEKNISKFKDC